MQYLLQNEIITDIEIDGANRKWIATHGGGLFLMSKDGLKPFIHYQRIIVHFIVTKSHSLAINNQNGELFIGTDKGILGYKSSAISSNIEFVNLQVYPNPVRPEYHRQHSCNRNDEKC